MWYYKKNRSMWVVTISQHVYFFFDDSGVFHINEPSGYFVYAGFVFSDRVEMETAKRKYINANRKIKNALGYDRVTELKAAGLASKHKRALLNSVLEYESVSVSVELARVYGYIMENKKSRCRYKDYILKRCIKNKLLDMISRGIIKSDEDTVIDINIDEQLTATDGYYDLRDSISEELQHGIVNFNYGVTHPKVFLCDVRVNIKYCESKNNYLIQASDVLANRIHASYLTGNLRSRNIPNHSSLTFP